MLCPLRQVVFTKTFFTNTSFNCNDRPFHLVVVVMREGQSQEAALSGTENSQPPWVHLVSLCSAPIHVDARKRTAQERPSAHPEDVCLANRQSIDAQAPKAIDATTSLVLPQTLVDSTGNAWIVISLDGRVQRVLTSSAYGWVPSQLLGTSFFALCLPGECEVIRITLQVMAATFKVRSQSASNDVPAVRMIHRIIHGPRQAATEPVWMDSIVSFDQEMHTISFCSRSALQFGSKLSSIQVLPVDP